MKYKENHIPSLSSPTLKKMHFIQLVPKMKHDMWEHISLFLK